MFKKVAALYLLMSMLFTTYVYAKTEFSALESENLSISSVIFKTNENSYIVPFIIKNNRTLIHIRCIAEILGYSVVWNNNEETATIASFPLAFTFKIGKQTVSIKYYKYSEEGFLDTYDTKNLNNWEKISTFDSAHIVVDGKTFVDLNNFTKLLGCNVNWDNTTHTVMISEKPIEEIVKVVPIFTKYGDTESTYHVGYRLTNLTDLPVFCTEYRASGVDIKAFNSAGDLTWTNGAIDDKHFFGGFFIGNEEWIRRENLHEQFLYCDSYTIRVEYFAEYIAYGRKIVIPPFTHKLLVDPPKVGGIRLESKKRIIESIEDMAKTDKLTFTNQIFVKFTTQKSEDELKLLLPNAKIKEQYSLTGSYLLEFDSIDEAITAVIMLNKRDDVYYAEPNYKISIIFG